MLSNIEMEFIQAFNPLYAFPIVTVVFCVVIVYAFGFKSPIQPPSFDGLDEDKKYTKKRKTKEIQKQNKSISNGKANGIATSKGKAVEVSRKKEISDNTEKLTNHDKLSGDKKSVKKVKSQSEKKIVQGKKENVSKDELIEDGWVQLISKKGRKNRKKDENIALNVQSNNSESIVSNELESRDNSDVKESPKHSSSDVKESPKHSSSDVTIVEKDAPGRKTQPIKSMKKNSNMTPASTSDSAMNLAASIENVIADENRHHLNIPTVIEESNKSKKKKKKQAVVTSDVTVTKVTSTLPSEVNINKITSPPLPSEVSVTKITSALPSDINSTFIEKSSPNPQKLESKSGDVPVNLDIDSQSNVAFDELAGLYPEAKEKKKKKVRRDH